MVWHLLWIVHYIFGKHVNDISKFWENKTKSLINSKITKCFALCWSNNSHSMHIQSFAIYSLFAFREGLKGYNEFKHLK